MIINKYCVSVICFLLVVHQICAQDELHRLCQKGDLTGVKEYVSNNKENLANLINQRSQYTYTPLMTTIVSTSRSELQKAEVNVKIARVLIENGADVNAVDKYGFTSLSHAAYFGAKSYLQEIAEEYFEILLAAHADPLIIDKFGLTAEQTMLDMCPKCSAVLRKYGYPEPDPPKPNPNWKEDINKNEL